MSAWGTGVVGALVEAWTQLPVGRLRVLLSLIGVGVAVAAMTFVIAFGQVSQVVQNDLMAQWNGRPGTVQLTITPTSGDGTDGSSSTGSDLSASGASEASDGSGSSADAAAAAQRVVTAEKDFVSRYEVAHWATSYQDSLRLDLGDGPAKVDATVVTAGYGILHRVQVTSGRWFTADDEDDLSPSIVVTQSVLDTMGIGSLTQPVRVRGLSPARTTYTIVGTIDSSTAGQTCDASGTCTDALTAYVLTGPYEAARSAAPASASSGDGSGGVTGPASSSAVFEVWAGAGRGAEMETLATSFFDGVLGHGSAQATSNEMDDQQDFGQTFTLVVTGAGVFIMLLGALGLINISLVTVRQRIHEIGVRRSFGATSRRIFFSIMLESVVATVVAGLIGIGVAIVAMRVVPLEAIFGTPVPTRPPFPMSAALIGLAAATGVGALAGLIPAIVAVRIRPIDAIRY